MFTGIITELGKVKAITPVKGGMRLEIAAKDVITDAKVGDSISVNGCCLTIVELSDNSWSADVVLETMKRTCLGELIPNDPVNLEASMKLQDRMGGHLVQGHVDGVGTIKEKKRNADGSTDVTIEAPASFLHYVVEKGSVAVDGVSLTVTTVTSNSFSFAMIPHTAKVTNLGWKQIGAKVNLEADLIAKYIEKMISPAYICALQKNGKTVG